jgi:hypothetical protein
MKGAHLLKQTGSWLYFTTLLLFITATLSRLLFNGMTFHFDYHLYQPDGAVYTYMALKYAGFSHLEAAREVILWYASKAEPGSSLALEFFDPEANSGIWSLGSTRVVYPLLSAPFVLLFGIPGMLVIPVLSFLLLLLLICKVAVSANNLTVGFLILFLLTTSSTVSRWYIANITDGPLATTIAFAVYLLYSSRSLKSNVILCCLVILGSFIRFSTPFWYGLATILWFTDRKKSVIVFFTSSIALVPILLAKPDPNSLVGGFGSGLVEKLLYFPVSALRVAFIEFAQLGAIDRPLLLLIITATFFSLRYYKDISSRFFIAVAMAGWFIGALNGVLGVNFRYQLPLVFFASWSILEKMHLSMNKSGTDAMQN